MSQMSENFVTEISDEEITTDIINEEIELSVKQTSTLIWKKKADVRDMKSKGKNNVWQTFGKVLVFGLSEIDIKLLNIDVSPES